MLKDGWEPSQGWYARPFQSASGKIWQVRLDGSLSAYSDVKPEPLFAEIGGAKGKWWVEHNGLTLHVRLPGDDRPE